MPIDTCVQNVGEYYSSHYLDSTFGRDMQQLQVGWREQSSRSVPRRLQALSERYFRAKSQALDEERPERRMLLGDEIAGWHGSLLDALGYSNREAVDVPVDANTVYVPILGRVFRYGKPWLFLAESPFTLPDSSLKDGMPSEDPLESEPLSIQLRDSAHKPCPGDWSRAVGKIFTEEDAPRWILMLGGSRLLLLDRDTFAQARYLAFDLDNAYGRSERASFECMAAFLSADTLCPSAESAELFHEKIETQSHKFAHGVSDKLQSAVREAIEILANEWVDYRKRKQLSYTSVARDGVLPENQSQVTAERLRHEALVFVYRLLFCFYAEAHGTEVNILPVNADEYRLGYSLEALRDLEQVPLTPETEMGEYFDHHVRQLFWLVYEGFNPEHDPTAQAALALEADPPTERAFSIRPLTATLFHPSTTPLFNLVRFSNLAWQKIVRNLSLSKDERSNTVGRVNYAELGLNELGAVYEGLLSYKGMFVPPDRDYIRVKPAGEDVSDSKTPTWFMSRERLDEFGSDEVERLPNGQPRIYPRGSFILHLNGVDRQQSASYYTPKPLTQSLVREALRELLKHFGPADADRILELTICEPAMGSGAFLYEAARQLADRYLELKVEQTGGTIEPADYADERRRVMHLITTRNVYGVDLNETAVELAGLSLWLGSIHRLPVREGNNGSPTIYEPGAPPWFGLRLRTGDSLIGARRAVWAAAQLKQGLQAKANGDAPRLLKPGEMRGVDEVYHFLVFDPDMLPTASDALMREHWSEQCSLAKNWIKEQVRPKWSDIEIRDALEICGHIDRYWLDFTARRKEALESTACTTSVWPTSALSAEARKPSPKLDDQEKVKAELEVSSGAFQRLRLLMDTWCALWFWPLPDVAHLPSREAWLASAQLLAGEKPPAPDMWQILSMRVGFDVSALLAASNETLPDSDALGSAVPWFRVARSLAEDLHFHHWELTFPEILGPSSKRGFDLILGNPPWKKPAWDDSVVLSEIEPLLGVRKARGAKIDAVRERLSQAADNLEYYAQLFRVSVGRQTVLSSRRLTPVLQGTQTNLYKNFIILCWGLLGSSGVAGMIHEDGVYDDAAAGLFRARYYRKLRGHFQFRNEKRLFQDVGHSRRYSINIFGAERSEIGFDNIANLFLPSTIDQSRRHSSPNDQTPGLKTEKGEWDTSGHTKRILRIAEDELAVCQKLLEAPGPVDQTPLIRVHSTDVLSVIRKIIGTKIRLKSIADKYYSTEFFHEGSAREKGAITRQDSPPFQPTTPQELILSGPNIGVGNAFAATPWSRCVDSKHYDDVDLTEVRQDYLPGAVYRPGDRAGAVDKFSSAIPVWQGSPITTLYRFVNRRRIDDGMERSLISCLVPPGVTNIDGLFSLCFAEPRLAVLFAGATHSIIHDFILRVTGASDCRRDELEALPLVEEPYAMPLIRRALRLNCISDAFAELWTAVSDHDVALDSWAQEDGRLKGSLECPWSSLTGAAWSIGVPLRTDFARRQALLEMDVLVALSLGLTSDELQTIYRVQFPVMRSFELADEFDSIGNRLPNTVRSDPGGREVREARTKHNGLDPLSVSWTVDNGRKAVSRTFYPPFTRVNREDDYARAYEVLESRCRGGC